MGGGDKAEASAFESLHSLFNSTFLSCNNSPLSSYHNGCRQFESKDYVAGQGHSRPQNPTRQVEAVSKKGVLLFIGSMLVSSTLDANGHCRLISCWTKKCKPLETLYVRMIRNVLCSLSKRKSTRSSFWKRLSSSC